MSMICFPRSNRGESNLTHFGFGLTSNIRYGFARLYRNPLYLGDDLAHAAIIHRKENCFLFKLCFFAASDAAGEDS